MKMPQVSSFVIRAICGREATNKHQRSSSSVLLLNNRSSDVSRSLFVQGHVHLVSEQTGLASIKGTCPRTPGGWNRLEKQGPLPGPCFSLEDFGAGTAGPAPGESALPEATGLGPSWTRSQSDSQLAFVFF